MAEPPAQARSLLEGWDAVVFILALLAVCSVGVAALIFLFNVQLNALMTSAGLGIEARAAVLYWVRFISLLAAALAMLTWSRGSIRRDTQIAGDWSAFTRRVLRESVGLLLLGYYWYGAPEALYDATRSYTRAMFPYSLTMLAVTIASLLLWQRRVKSGENGESAQTGNPGI